MKNLIYILAFIFIGCTARKSELAKNEKDSISIDKTESKTFDYSKLMQSDFKLDTGVVFTKEYFDNGNVKSERIESKNEVKTQYKTEVKTRYKILKIYKKYKITETTKIKKTQKEGVSFWVWVVFGVLLYFLIKKGSFLFL